MKSLPQVWREYLESQKNPDYNEIWVATEYTTTVHETFKNINDLTVLKSPHRVRFTQYENDHKKEIEINGRIVYSDKCMK